MLFCVNVIVHKCCLHEYCVTNYVVLQNTKVIASASLYEKLQSYCYFSDEMLINKIFRY